MRIVSLALVLLSVVGVVGQAPIPYRPDGYQVGGPLDAPIQFEAYLDMLCPDSAAAWDPITSLIYNYGKNISVNVHTFPLPYHTFGFMAAQATHVVLNNIKANSQLSVADKAQSSILFIQFLFQNQAEFWNGAVANYTSNDVLAHMTNMIVSNGFIGEKEFSAGMASPYVNDETRVSWKYACSRGVLGTPTFFVNGVFVNGSPSWTLADWRQILDPLLQPQPSMMVEKEPLVEDEEEEILVKPKCSPRSFKSRLFKSNDADCPAGRPVCNYLPGKFECCYPGENWSVHKYNIHIAWHESRNSKSFSATQSYRD